ncbi:MAG: HD domain-containing protein [Clostridium sp.]
MKIDRIKAAKVFKDYVQNYNAENGKVKLKITHTYKVSAICEEIAKRIGLSSEDIDIAYLTGLLHDIGRFEQVKQYGTFHDAVSINHAALGVKILFEEGKIRDFIDDDSEDELIRKAIKYHNAFELPDTLSKREEVFAKILRDADKIDIFRVNVTDPIEDVCESKEGEILNSTVTEAVLESFRRNETILRKIEKTAVDNVVAHVAYIFGIYFDESIKIVEEQGYFEKLTQFKYDNELTNKQMEEVREIAHSYINKRIKKC